MSDRAEIGALAANNLTRMLADGIEYVDFAKVTDGLSTMEEWCMRWMEVASDYEQRAQKALAERSRVTAGELFWRASLCEHYAQFMIWHNEDLKRRAMMKKVENYIRGAPFFVPPGERIEVPFERTVLPGFLRLPSGRPEPPFVVLIGGLESTKEEYYAFENLCLRRGLATFAFDGPGQGEALPNLKSRPDFEKATSAVIDHLVKRDDIDDKRIAVLGRSLGGHYAARSAAFDKRIGACVAWGALYDFTMWEDIPSDHKDGWTYTAGLRTWDEARAYYSRYTLAGVASKITCPLYVLQGRLDNIFPPEQASRLANEAKGKTTLVLEEKGNHCAHNMGQIVRPRMVDWLAQTLGADH